jgi:ribosome-binding protein aMBF1 (putative translation factor)
MTHDELKKNALLREDVKAEYEALAPEFELLRTLLKARQEAGLTQAQVAERMGTRASAVARLESALSNGKHSPSVAYTTQICTRSESPPRDSPGSIT